MALIPLNHRTSRLAESIRCRATRAMGPGISGRLPRPMAEHLRECLRCQADAARYSKLQRSLGRLSGSIERAPLRIAARVDVATGEEPVPDGRSRSVRTAVAALSATTAAALGITVVALRRRAQPAA